MRKKRTSRKMKKDWREFLTFNRLLVLKALKKTGVSKEFFQRVRKHEEDSNLNGKRPNVDFEALFTVSFQ